MVRWTLRTHRVPSEILRAKGLGPRRLHLHVEEGGRHREGYWAGRLPGALRFLFG